jgi:hypothetical protein
MWDKPWEQIHLRSKFLRVKLPTAKSLALFRNSLVDDGQAGSQQNKFSVSRLPTNHELAVS